MYCLEVDQTLKVITSSQKQIDDQGHGKVFKLIREANLEMVELIQNKLISSGLEVKVYLFVVELVSLVFQCSEQNQSSIRVIVFQEDIDALHISVHEIIRFFYFKVKFIPFRRGIKGDSFLCQLNTSILLVG